MGFPDRSNSLRNLAEDRIVSPSLVLNRLGSYARQNSVYQCLAEIGRVHKTVHVLKTLDDEEYRRRMGGAKQG
jgi:TnpA family transposase